MEVAAAGAPDIVLLDVLVPGAFEVVPRLAPARVVLVSSRPPEELATVAAAAGAVGYIGKDLAPSDLPAAINDVTRVFDRLEAVLAKATEELPAPPQRRRGTRPGAVDPRWLDRRRPH